MARIVERGPIPAIHGVVRWRRKDLALWIYEEFGISLEETTVGRKLRVLGFRKISARPRHKGQNEFAVEDFRKTSHQYRVGNMVARRSQGWAKDQTHYPEQHHDHAVATEGPICQKMNSLEADITAKMFKNNDVESRASAWAGNSVFRRI
ncbi:MAG TPA: winged helix-turn-helix domain-containing protein [Rhodospirillales bacterium]|nr:winged helix-turn-helix domain-containing protein [Rhodospirillales bacterium]